MGIYKTQMDGGTPLVGGVVRPLPSRLSRISGLHFFVKFFFRCVNIIEINVSKLKYCTFFPMMFSFWSEDAFFVCRSIIPNFLYRRAVKIAWSVAHFSTNDSVILSSEKTIISLKKRISKSSPAGIIHSLFVFYLCCFVSRFAKVYVVRAWRKRTLKPSAVNVVCCDLGFVSRKRAEIWISTRD